MSTDIPTNDTLEIPETPETEGRSPETQKKTVNHWIADLIETKQSINDIKEIRDAINDPKKYDTWLASIGNEIDLKYREDADQTNEPIDKDIVKKCFENKEFIVAKAQKILFKRELAERDLHKYWTGYTIEDSSGHTLTAYEIQDIIEKVPTNQLTELTKNITKSIDHLSEYTIMTPHIHDYMRDMGVEVARIDEKDRKKLLYQFAVFDGVGDFNEDMLSILFEHIPDADKKREAIKMILPKISLKDALEKGIISEDKKQDILESVFFEYLRDNGLLTGGESTLSDWLTHSDSTITSQREYHKNAFIAEANKNTGGVYIDTTKQEFFQDGVAFSESSFDHDAFDSAFEAITPLMNEELRERMKDNVTESHKELRENTESFEDMKSYLATLPLPSFAEGNISMLQENTYIRTTSTPPIDDAEPIMHTWQIAAIDETTPTGEKGLRLISYDSVGGKCRSDDIISYADFVKSFTAEVVGMADSGSVKITRDQPDFIDENDLMSTLTEFEEAINTFDPQGRAYGLSSGLSLAFEISGEIEMITITQIDSRERMIHLQTRVGKPILMTWAHFIHKLEEGDEGKPPNMRRVGNFQGKHNFAENTAIKDSASLKYENGKIKFEEEIKDKEGRTNKQHSELRALSNGKGEHIYIKKAHDDLVEMWYYTSEKDENKKEIHDDEGKVKRKYKKIPPVSYERLEEFIQNGFTHPLSAPPKVSNEAQEAEMNKYKNKSFLGGLLGQPGSLYSKYLAVKMGFQRLQSARDEKAQVQAAEAMYKWAQTLPKGSKMRYAFTAEFSHTVGGQIDKKISELGTFGATEKRENIRDILRTDPPQPYELFAALIVTVKMSGELYPDAELAPLQGEGYLWFTALAKAMGKNPGEELAAAKKKVIDEYGNQKDHLPETALITRLFKKNNAHPYVTAIGSGAKYWHAVEEGLDGQKGKGEKEAKKLDSDEGASAIVSYAMSKYKSNELPIVAGAIPVLYDKDPSAEYLGPAFVWAMSNATNLVRGDISKTDVMLKNIVNGGSAFHAFCFSGSPSSAKKYQDTVHIVAKYLKDKGKISTSDFQDLEECYNQIQNNPYSHNEAVFQKLGKFWENNYKAIHPILQGTSPELLMMMDDPNVNQGVIKEYTKSFDAMMAFKFKNSKGMDDGMAMFGGYSANETGSMIFQLKKEGSNYKSIGHILGKCTINGHNLTMDMTTYDYVWKTQVIEYINSLRENPAFSGNENYRKTQYKIIIQEIIEMLRPKLREPHHAEEVFEGAKSYPYFDDLRNIGIDMDDYSNFMNGDINNMCDDAYQKFMLTSRKSTSEDIVKRSSALAHEIQKTGELGKPANDADWDFRNAA